MDTVPATGRRAVLAVVSGGNFAQLGVRFLIGAVVPLVLVSFDTTKSTVGLALTGMWAIYALVQFPSGILADRFGEKALLIAGLAGTIGGAALVALSPSILLFGVFTVVLGAGTGLFFSPASSLLTRLYDEQGSTLGILTASGALAGVVYPIGGSILGTHFDWRVAVGASAVVGLPILLMTVALPATLPPANPTQPLRDALDWRRWLSILARPRVTYTTAVAIMMGFTYQAISSFLPTFLVEYRGLSAGSAGILFGVVFGLSSIAQPIAGRLSDRRSRDASISSSVVLTGTALLTLVFVPGLVGLALGIVVLGVGVSWPGTMQARFMDQLTDAERGFGFGLVRTVYMFVGASGSVVVGTLAESFGWSIGYGAVVAILCVALVVLGTNRVLGLDL